jgi:hypothetical protein
MKTRSKNFRVIFVLVLAACSLAILSCSRDLCPTYQAPMERVKSIRSEEINGSWERKSVPSPRSEKSKSQAKKKYLAERDSLKEAGEKL